MGTRASSPRTSLRVSASLLLVGQFLYIAFTLFHAGGEANDHHAIFATYAANTIWTTVHMGQFLSVAILLAGLFALFFALDVESGMVRWTGYFGAATAVAALALYGVLQAVDGVALKQAVNAWASAPDAEKPVRFATAETIRWLEWGMRSYQDVAQGLALLLFAAAVARTAWIPRLIGFLIGLSGVAYLIQGWIAGVDGFSSAQSMAIVVGWILSLVWMNCLFVAAWRSQDVERIHQTVQPSQVK